MALASAVPAIAGSFVLLAGLLLWFVIGSTGRWYLKLPLIVVTPLFMFLVWSALGSFTGWPTRAELPTRSYFIAGTVSEPEPDGDGGAIRVWVIPPSGDGGPFAYEPDRSRPRAFELPYTQALHRQVQAANAMRARGEEVELRASNEARQGDDRAGRAKGARRSGHSGRGPFRAYRLPPPSPPRKGSAPTVSSSSSPP
jgi:hypothetical protein